MVGPYSVAQESAAFKKLHTLNVAIRQLRDQGNDYGVQSLLPYFRAALADYKRIGNTDPDYLSDTESFILSLGTVGSGALTVLDTLSKRVLVGGVIAVVLLALWKRR